MDLVHIRLLWFLRLMHLDRVARNHIQRPPVWHHPDIIVENPSGMEKWHCEAQNLFHDELNLVNEWVILRLQLIVQLIFAKSQSRHEVCPCAYGQLNETFAALQDKPQRLRSRIERFSGSTHNNRDGTTHALAVGAPVR